VVPWNGHYFLTAALCGAWWSQKEMKNSRKRKIERGTTLQNFRIDEGETWLKKNLYFEMLNKQQHTSRKTWAMHVTDDIWWSCQHHLFICTLLLILVRISWHSRLM
jgi:hypothetical protein